MPMVNKTHHKRTTLPDRIRGSLLGLAAGDAVDTTVECKQQGWLAMRSPVYGAKHGAPGGDRTHNLRLRRPTLYPIELRVHVC